MSSDRLPAVPQFALRYTEYRDAGGPTLETSQSSLTSLNGEWFLCLCSCIVLPRAPPPDCGRRRRIAGGGGGLRRRRQLRSRGAAGAVGAVARRAGGRGACAGHAEHGAADGDATVRVRGHRKHRAGPRARQGGQRGGGRPAATLSCTLYGRGVVVVHSTPESSASLARAAAVDITPADGSGRVGRSASAGSAVHPPALGARCVVRGAWCVVHIRSVGPGTARGAAAPGGSWILRVHVDASDPAPPARWALQLALLNDEADCSARRRGTAPAAGRFATAAGLQCSARLAGSVTVHAVAAARRHAARCTMVRLSAKCRCAVCGVRSCFIQAVRYCWTLHSGARCIAPFTLQYTPGGRQRIENDFAGVDLLWTCPVLPALSSLLY